MSYRQDLFLDTTRNLRSGKTQDELSEALNECVVRAREVGKAAELTLKITVKPVGDSGQYFLADKVTTKLPEHKRNETLMFGTPEGNLQRTDPDQGELPLRSVADNDQPKSVTDSTQIKTIGEQP